MTLSFLVATTAQLLIFAIIARSLLSWFPGVRALTGVSARTPGNQESRDRAMMAKIKSWAVVATRKLSVIFLYPLSYVSLNVPDREFSGAHLEYETGSCNYHLR